MHRWPATPAEAIALQRELAGRVYRSPTLPQAPRLVAGLDLSGEYADGTARASVVVLALPALTVHEVKVWEGTVAFPYVPGLLSFREVPLLLGALSRLRSEPDCLLVDGQGLAHPRRFGLACHLGVLMDVPAIGCAKSRLCGRYQDLAIEKGAWAPLIDKGDVVGAAVRTRTGVSPVYVSIGHRVDLDVAVETTLACTSRYRIPEPTRLAHQAAAGRLAATAPVLPA